MRRIRQGSKAMVTKREHLLILFHCQANLSIAREFFSLLFPFSISIITEITLDNITDLRK